MQFAAFMLARAIPRFVPLVALLVFPCCGGKSIESAGPGSGGAAGGGDVAGSSAGGAAQAGANGGGTGVGGFLGEAGAGGSGGSIACEPYLDQAGTIVQVELVNHTQQAIYFGPQTPGCGGPAEIQVADASGAFLVPQFCQLTCQNVIQGTTLMCRGISCPVNSTFTLQPGESTLREWGGAFLRQVRS